ncbi:MAG: coenzyme F420-0:L-glutamate ligase [Candidatus Thorarchaeota archaeon]
MTSNNIEIFPLPGIPLVSEKDDIASMILGTLQDNDVTLLDGDILVIAHTIISKAEGRIVNGAQVSVSIDALRIAEENGFDPVQVQIAMNESIEILRTKRALITKLEDGHICNFSGVDRSNAPEGSFVLLPIDADKSAEEIRRSLCESTGKSIAIIISDTEGRPWRKGAINLAIGCAGINAFKYNEGKQDLYGRTLQHSLVCQIDQIASAAEMVMGQAGEGLPVVIISRSHEENLFR